jgi:hypothetical protein
MQTVLVFGIFGFAVALALLLLYAFHAKAWYWHVLSIAAAIGIGMVPIGSLPIPEEWMTHPVTSLVIGGIFLFLFFWGVAAPFFRAPRAARQVHHA